MKLKLQTLTLLIMIAALTGCQSLNQTIVTITEVRYNIMVELGSLHFKGLVSPELDQKIEALDARYREAAGIAEAALVAYESGKGDEAGYLKALNVSRAIVFELIDVVTPLLSSGKTKQLSSTLTKATLP